MKKTKEPTLRDIAKTLDDVVNTLGGVTKTLKDHSELFTNITKTLEVHGKMLGEHGEVLGEHGKTLEEHGRMLGEHGDALKGLQGIRETLKEHDELFAFIIEHMATKADLDDLRIELNGNMLHLEDRIDRKLENLHGDTVAMTRKVDQKDSGLVRVLSKKQLVTKPEAEKLLAMSPFPHVAR